jgi:hypothetical protein
MDADDEDFPVRYLLWAVAFLIVFAAAAGILFFVFVR